MADVYKIAVEIALAGTIIQGLESIARHLGGIHTKVSQVEGGFARWGVAIAGAGAIFAGSALIKGLDKALDLGGELIKQQAMLKAMGFGDADVTRATGTAQRATMSVYGTTIAGNLEHLRELTGVMPSLEEAEKALPLALQAAKISGIYSKQDPDKGFQTLVKAVENMGGGIDPKTGKLDRERFTKELEAVEKAIIASGGLVNSQNIGNFVKQAGPMARMHEDPEAFWKGIMTGVMDMGGFRAGTALTAIGRQLFGGKMTAPTAESLEELGLIHKGKWHKAGTGVKFDKGALEGEDILSDMGPGGGVKGWFERVYLPKLAKAGITGAVEIQKRLYKDFGTETARRLAGLYIQQKSQVERDAALYDQVGKPESTFATLKAADWEGAKKNFEDSLVNLMQAFSGPMVPVAIKAINSLADAINNMAGWALAHPDAAKNIGIGIAALAGALIVLGGTAVVAAVIWAAGTIGLIVAGIGSLAIAIGVLAALNFDAVSAGLKTVSDAISGFLSMPHPLTNLPNPGDFGGTPPAPGKQENLNDIFGGGKRSMNIVPTPRDQKPIVLTANMTIDSTPVARIVENKIAEMHELADAASAPNRVAYLGLGDSDPTANLG